MVVRHPVHVPAHEHEGETVRAFFVRSFVRQLTLAGHRTADVRRFSRSLSDTCSFHEEKRAEGH